MPKTRAASGGGGDTTQNHLSKNKFKNGFTLAEVLVTLTILGVVSAMTIPTLIRKQSQKINTTKFKKSISVINQALKMNYAINGFDLSTVQSNCKDKKNDDASVMSVCSIFNETMLLSVKEDYTTYKNSDGNLYYLDLYQKGVTSDSEIKNQGIQLYYYGTNDGSMFIFHSPHIGDNHTPICTLAERTLEAAAKDSEFVKYCLAWVDVNGGQKPNKEVRCKDKKAYYGKFTQPCKIDETVDYDVFPVFIYDSTIVPASTAANKVLQK